MNNEWTEWLKQLPSWIKGGIGLTTLIVGFLVLFRDNYHLSIIVVSVATLITTFCFSIYIAFSKRRSGLVGGGHIYRFEQRYRRVALIG